MAFVLPRILRGVSGRLVSRYRCTNHTRFFCWRQRLQNTAICKENQSEMFTINDYDVIGFDLDNTILRYKAANCVQMEYNVLVEFLVEQRNYSPKYLTRPLSEKEDFLQKGLVLDFDRGNLLRIDRNGIVMAAAHGTQLLSETQIREVYGEKRQWETGRAFATNILEAWNGPLSEKLRNLLDYFDMPVSVIFARIVDTLDEDNGGKWLEKYNIWPDVVAGLMHIYSREHFDMKSNYFKSIKCNPDKFLYKTQPHVLQWLKELRQKKTVFLLTGSHMDFADFTSTYALGGPEWAELFDLVVCFARKPGFFTENRPFINLRGYEESDPVTDRDNLKLETKFYCQGNVPDLVHVLQQKSGTANPKILYVGDNLIQDVYTPSAIANWDTVAIVEELLAEHINSLGQMSATSKISIDHKLLGGSGWGSYFHVNQNASFWCDIIKSHAKICIPSLETLAERPIEHNYESFANGHSFPVQLGSDPGFHF